MGIIKTLGNIEKGLKREGIITIAEADASKVIENGKFDLLRVYTELKRYELYLKTVIDKIKDPVVEKAVESGEKVLDMGSAKITLYSRTTYDYSNDHRWQSFKNEIDGLTHLRKQREALLKELKPGETRQFVDEETGEIDEMVAPPYETKMGLIVKIKP